MDGDSAYPPAIWGFKEDAFSLPCRYVRPKYPLL